jgi:hypothetical protein
MDYLYKTPTAVLTFGVAVGLWLLFYPALMSADSVSHYKEAVLRSYTDWHPSIMPMTLSLVMALGGDIGALMLIQCTAGCFAVRYLARVIMIQSGMHRPMAGWGSLVVLVLLLAPFSPLAFYLMTFWKDSWLAILLLWIVALALRLHDEIDAERARQPWLRIFILAGTMAFAAMTRHNAIVLLPVFCVVLYVGLRRRQAFTALFLCLLPAALFGVSQYLQNTCSLSDIVIPSSKLWLSISLA